MKIQKIIDRLCNAGYHVYITGGCVRDQIAGLPAHDEDIVTNAKPEEVVTLFEKDHKVLITGKTFPVVKVDGVDVATYRQDNYAGLDRHSCEVKFVETLEEDLFRRDFTWNAMAYCEHTGEIIDPFGGREDLKKKVIRFTSDPDKLIHNDPLRILRACRIGAGKLGFSFECKTYEALVHKAHYVRDYVAKERIRDEILKAMEYPKPSLFFQALYEIGALEYVFPSMVPCAAHHHGKHHREDIFTHLMICGDSLSPKDPILRLAGYLHDIGKPESYSDDGRFVGHEKVGAVIASRELENLRFSTSEIQKISGLVKAHMNSLTDISPRPIRKLLHRLGELNVDYLDFLKLRIADRTANLAKSNMSFIEIRTLLTAFNQVLNVKIPMRVTDLAINGNIIMEILGIPPGPGVGKELKKLLDFVLENGPEFNTEEHLISKLEKENV
jgi:tRNA nucleotidyltransferase (CCA-adding enzyme)